MRFRQSSLKKFVLPFLTILLLSGASGVNPADTNDFKVFMLTMNLQHEYPEHIASKKNRKSADWFFDRARHLKVDIFSAKVRKLLLEKAHDAIKPLYPKGVTIALDITKQSVYTKSKSKYILGGKAERGTTRAYHFLGACILERQAKYPLGFCLLQRGDMKRLGSLVRHFLGEIADQLTIRHVVLDRGFSWASVIHELQDLHISYIVGYTRTRTVKKLISFLEEPLLASRDSFFVPALQTKIDRVSGTCWVVKEYSYGEVSVTTQLILCKVPVRRPKRKNGKRLRWEFFPFIADPSIDPSIVLGLYGTRWRIETAFRLMKSLCGKTRSLHPGVRVWILGVACLLYASWVLRHVPVSTIDVLPEFLETERLQKQYSRWERGRTPVWKMQNSYLSILLAESSVLSIKEVN